MIIGDGRSRPSNRGCSMLDALKFVQGAIQKNGITPDLEHYIIKDGRVTGFNGYMALSAPLPLDIEAMPKADLFHKAIKACGEKVSLTLTEAGRLHIRSGPFSAFVPCIERVVYEAQPEGESFAVPEGLAAAFATMLPFISDDASRPWAMGLSMANGCYTATNNVILLQQWTGHALPPINCPRFAVAEVARVGVDPVEMRLADGALSFIYEDGRWLRTQLLTHEWPTETMSRILDKPSEQEPVKPELFEAVRQLVPFLEERFGAVHFEDFQITTHPQGAEAGAAIAFEGLPAGLAFRAKALEMLEGIMTTIDWDTAPCLFFGQNMRGALIGMQY